MKNFGWKQLLQEKNSIFFTVPDQKIEALLADGVSTERTYAKDKDIVRQDEEGDSLFVIGSGSAEALLAVAGEETIHLSTMRKGDVFGEMAFFGRRERAATVRAKEDCIVLEIGGPEFQNLVKECPDVESRLLLLMGERLRNTNEKILALHLKTVDEKLKLFSNRLDNEQKSVDIFLKAAQTVFDQTKLRTDEVINSAERSRTRLNTSATVVGGFVTVLVALLGLFGWKQVADIGVQLDKATASAQYVADVKKEMPGPTPLAEIKSSVDDLKKLKTEAEQLNKDAKDLVDSVKDSLKDSVIAAHRRQFYDAAGTGSGLEAVKAYAQIREAGGLDSELALMLDWVGSTVVAKAQPQPRGSDQELSVKNFVNLFQQAVVDAQKPRDRLDAYYLLLVYAYLTGQVAFEQRDQGKYRGFATPQEALAALQKYGKSLPSAPPSLLETKGLKDHWLSQGADKDVLGKFSDLALVGGK